MTPGSRQQAALLRFVRGFQETYGFGPSYEEIAAGIGLAARSQVHFLVDLLEERDLVRRHRGKRSLELLAPISIPRAPDGAPLRIVPIAVAP